MPSIANRPQTTAASATATGLTGLDQTAAAFSWSAWLWRSTSTSTGRISLWCHADNQSSPRNGITLRASATGDFSFAANTSAQNATFSRVGIIPHGWSHVGVRYDGTTVAVFVNRRLVDVQAFSTAPTVSGTRVTQIGFSQTGSACIFGWRLWDIRVFPALALSYAEMQSLADPRSFVRGCKQRLCYQHNWRSQGSGAVTLFDESGNGNHLTTSATTLLADTDAEPRWRQWLYGQRVYGKVMPVIAMQELLPDGTLSNTGWTADGAGSIHAALNDNADTTMAWAAADGAVATVSLADPSPTFDSITAGRLGIWHRIRP